MKRIKNIDLLRAGAILYIMLYHCYVLSGQPWQAHTAIHTILTLGGEVGVTLFFLLSGYGIYLSLSSSEERGCLPGWRAFMKKRRMFLRPGVVKGLCRKMIRKISVKPPFPSLQE